MERLGPKVTRVTELGFVFKSMLYFAARTPQSPSHLFEIVTVIAQSFKSAKLLNKII